MTYSPPPAARRLNLAIESIRENVNGLLTLLPTTEYQCRPLVKLTEEEQFEAWQMVVEQAGAKAPTSAGVKQAVLEIEQRAIKEEPIFFAVDEVVRICVKDNPELAGQGGHLAVVKEVGTVSCTLETAMGGREVQVHPQHFYPAGLKPEVEAETRQLIR